MKLRTKYILFVAILHLVALVLTYFIFRQNQILFIVSEVFIIISIIVAWQLYNQLIQPLKMLLQGAEAIKDRDFNIKFLATGKFEMDELIHVYNQMIEQLRTERTKQEQQHFFLEKLIYTSPTGIMILDYENVIKQVNPKALQLLAMEANEIVEKQINEIVNPVLQQVALLQSGESKTITLNGVVTYKLQKAHFVDRGFARHFIMLEELTAEILAAEKKAYGKVIRMMAHEVNNTIGPVNSILQSALKKEILWQDDNTQNIKAALQAAVDRNYSLNIFMRNFADVVRLPEPRKANINLHEMLHSMMQLMETKAAEKSITFSYIPDELPMYIFADKQQLEQVFINIIKNAIEAIEHEGLISITTNTALKQLVITDTGAGIEDTVAEQLFSPFFSTKKDGQGIGLTLVKEILLNHRFDFSLKTNTPGNTNFTIMFSPAK
ncbi:MAG TPA: ATP-binding protein [Chitinophagaceae bacterium]|nr:ATP-binding protein [Chitinophagaceae bacterium]